MLKVEAADRIEYTQHIIDNLELKFNVNHIYGVVVYLGSVVGSWSQSRFSSYEQGF